MDYFDIAVSARARWEARKATRSPKMEKIRAGKALEAESSERIQKRLDRLAINVGKTSAALERTLENPPEGRLVETIGLERIIGRSDFLDINFIETALAVARFVGRINIRNAQGRSLGYGTGFMVSPRLLLTNNHVLPDATTAQRSTVEFDFQNDRVGRPLPVVGFRLDPMAFFMTDTALDFTLVAVSESSMAGVPLQLYGWSRLIGDEGKALIGEPLNVIQHPRGEAKQIVLRSNELVDLFDQYAHYVADTEPGSSGSPVFNDQWEVVALHHSGVPKKDEQGRYIARDGTLWTSGMDPDALDWVANEGIRVSSLINHISRQPLSGQQAQLCDDLLNLEPPSPLEAAAASMSSSGTDASLLGPGRAHRPVINGNAASWTIPLTFTVQLGDMLPANMGAGPAAPHIAAPTAVRQTAAPAPAPKPAAKHPPELTSILAELERSCSRPYYDATTDERKRVDYYRGIDTSASSATLYHSLHQLLTRTHQRPLSYKPAQHVYPWVDLQPPPNAQKLASLYSGKLFDASEMIENDFAIEAMRNEWRASLRKPALQGQETVMDEMTLEAMLPYNCEHVVPQSWFGKREPMRGDLHHLFACESGCNSFRGNIPYFDFVDFQEAVRTDCGKREENKFEPAAGKGAAARASLYFLIRYPKEINDTLKELSTARIKTLLEWHHAFPADVYELHRNAAIQEMQGNRNPLIDFPQWADRIDFRLGLG